MRLALGLLIGPCACNSVCEVEIMPVEADQPAGGLTAAELVDRLGDRAWSAEIEWVDGSVTSLQLAFDPVEQGLPSQLSTPWCNFECPAIEHDQFEWGCDEEWMAIRGQVMWEASGGPVEPAGTLFGTVYGTGGTQTWRLHGTVSGALFGLPSDRGQGPGSGCGVTVADINLEGEGDDLTQVVILGTNGGNRDPCQTELGRSRSGG